MKLDDYQAEAKVVDALPTETRAAIVALGLAGEAGEVTEHIKKYLRRGGKADGSELPEGTKNEILLELGDVLWYVAMMADIVGEDLSVVAEMNLQKLFNRYQKAR